MHNQKRLYTAPQAYLRNANHRDTNKVWYVYFRFTDPPIASDIQLKTKKFTQIY